jgi:hypothetical protein
LVRYPLRLSTTTTTTTHTKANKIMSNKTLSQEELNQLLHTFNNFTASPEEIDGKQHLSQLTSPLHIKHLIHRDCGPSHTIHVSFVDCISDKRGYYSSTTRRISLCKGHMNSAKDFHDVLSHELMHMYDHCAFNINWYDIRQVVCSEIRAAMVGNCSTYDNELKRRYCSINSAIASSKTRFDEQSAKNTAREMFDKCSRNIHIDMEEEEDLM